MQELLIQINIFNKEISASTVVRESTERTLVTLNSHYNASNNDVVRGLHSRVISNLGLEYKWSCKSGEQI